MKRANCSALVPLESSDSWAAGALARGGNKVVGGKRRRALRGPGAPAGGRGRTETPPAKLSACVTCQAACGGGDGACGKGAIDGAPQSKRGGARGARERGGGCEAANRSGEPPRAMRTRGAHGYGARRRDGDIAPYRNGTAPRGA